MVFNSIWRGYVPDKLDPAISPGVAGGDAALFADVGNQFVAQE
jgi:hypothetical protein